MVLMLALDGVGLDMGEDESDIISRYAAAAHPPGPSSVAPFPIQGDLSLLSSLKRGGAGGWVMRAGNGLSQDRETAPTSWGGHTGWWHTATLQAAPAPYLARWPADDPV